MVDYHSKSDARVHSRFTDQVLGISDDVHQVAVSVVKQRACPERESLVAVKKQPYATLDIGYRPTVCDQAADGNRWVGPGTEQPM